MTNIPVKLKTKPSAPYTIFIGRDFGKSISGFLKKNFSESACVIITDNKVRKLYGEKLQRLLGKNGRTVFLFSIPSGETSKNQKYKTIIEQKMLRLRLDRQTVIVALGGGVPGDLAGFIAATYMRGIPYIQVPTTLLAMVDSSIGGKTGIDTPQGKNLIGALWQPEAVFIGLECLRTLHLEQFKNGLVEAVKMFATSDSRSFNYVEKNIAALLGRDEQTVKIVVKNAIRIKVRIVARDERENGERMTLNFGHTIGHALEKISKYKILHGYAVAAGMLVEAGAAQSIGLLPASDYLRLRKLLVGRMGVSLKPLTYRTGQIMTSVGNDKKAVKGRPRYVLLKKIGEVQVEKNRFAHPVKDAVVDEVLRKIKLTAKI
ncbi:MAG: 3-dehydroquinate synthase [bacterium]|nr:3-dehydroquinate synthase [bacterium]